MSETAIILILLSAVIHASWNLASKKQHPSIAFFLGANVIGCLLLTPLAIYNSAAYAQYSHETWGLAVLSGMCMALYFAGLAGAYRHGDMSVAYPLARSSAIVVVVIVTILLGNFTELSRGYLSGAGLIVVGCFFLPMRRFDSFRWKNYRNWTSAFALLAACGTAGYSMLDDAILHNLRAVITSESLFKRPEMSYIFIESLSVTFWLLILLVLIPAEQRELKNILRFSKRYCLLTGTGIYAAYLLVLVAMGSVNNISYVVAFRQVGIPLGAGLGMTLLNEPRYRPKMAGVAILCLGLLLVALK